MYNNILTPQNRFNNWSSIYYLLTNHKKYLIANISTLINNNLANINFNNENENKIKTIDKNLIKRKLSKLKELYLNVLISLDEYKATYEKYNSQLKKSIKNRLLKIKLFLIPQIFSFYWIKLYNNLSNEKKRIFWRQFISKIFPCCII